MFAAPPPYQLSSQELDRKVDAVLEESIAVLSNEAEIWEDWDEATFEAAAQAATGVGASYAHSPEKTYSALPSAQPLRINKKEKLQPPSTSWKDRPCWFEEAGLGGSSSSSTYRQEDARPSPFTHTASVSDPSGSSVFVAPHQLALADEEEDRSIAPPPFTAVGPSLDGPPFEAIDSARHLNNAHASPPPSPLVSPTVVHPSLPAPSMASSLLLQPDPRHPSPRQSLPAHSRTYAGLGPRPVSSAGNTPRPMMTTPVVGFDPLMAYTKPRRAASPGAQLRANEVGSFYNSAVAPYLTNRASKPPLNPVTYPSQRPRASAGGFGHSALANENDWARDLYDQYPSNPTPALPATMEHPQYQSQQYQPQQYQPQQYQPQQYQPQQYQPQQYQPQQYQPQQYQPQQYQPQQYQPQQYQHHSNPRTRPASSQGYQQ